MLAIVSIQTELKTHFTRREYVNAWRTNELRRIMLYSQKKCEHSSEENGSRSATSPGRERASGARGAGKGGGRGTTVPGQGARGRPSAQSVFPKKRLEHVERENTQKQNTRAFSRDKKLKLWIKGTWVNFWKNSLKFQESHGLRKSYWTLKFKDQGRISSTSEQT